jgi:hypothetical protein
MVKEPDGNNKLVSEIIHSFTDRWMDRWLVRRNANGTYAITIKCKNVIKQVEVESSGM